MARAGWSIVAIVVALFAFMVLIAWGRAQSFPIDALAKAPPPRTAMMAQREREAAAKGRKLRIDHRWVSYGRVAPILRRAVLVAEDDAFFAHGGLDWNELQASAKENWKKKRVARGGSTITQQLAKNLYLGDARTPWRKLTELFVALRLERALSKRRIFELYLNSIEWGNGVFGIEAAARRHFGVSASQLNARQSVLLAAVIINPRKYSPVEPNRRIQNRARTIARRLLRRGVLDEEGYRLAIGEKPKEEGGLFGWLFGRKDDAPPTPAPGDSSAAAAADSTAVTPDEPEPEPLPEPAPASPDSI